MPIIADAGTTRYRERRTFVIIVYLKRGVEQQFGKYVSVEVFVTESIISVNDITAILKMGMRIR